MEKQLAYYTLKIISTLCLLALGLALLVFSDSLWLLLLGAVFMALVFGQMGLIGHDAGHRQIFRSVRNNEIIGLIISLLIASPRTWWIDKHNRHHNNPNDLDRDPDTFVPVVAFSEEQALERKGFYGFIVKYQSYFFFPMLCLEGLGLRLASAQYMLRKKLKYPVLEPTFMAAHVIVYLGLAFYFLSPWHAVLFIVVHQAAFGLYMGLVFAPNHKGMPIMEKDSKMGFLRRQVITARNVRPNPLTDFLYGGLNHQIEHHLFPSMPRSKLGEARKIVKAFCHARSIPYHETSVLRSQLEIVRYLHQVSSPLRQKSNCV